MKYNIQAVLLLAFVMLGWSVNAQDISTQTKPTNLELISQDVSFHTDRFDLVISSDGQPKTITLSSGKQVVRRTTGLTMINFDKSRVALDKLYKSGEDYVFASKDEKYYATFSIKPTPHYVAFKLKDFYGDVPLGTVMEFMVAADEKTKVFPYDYATKDWSNKHSCRLSFDHLWERYKGNSLGGFALYTFSTPEEQDESILRAWGAEEVPHPKVAGEWNYDRALEWMKEWMKMFADQSVFYIEPENFREMALYEPYLKKAGVTTVNFFTNVWHNGFWPTNTLNWEVNGVFGSKEKLRQYSLSQRKKGRSINMHYISGGIGNLDPVYAKENLSEELASWVDGDLAKDISKEDKVIYFKPKESWYKMPNGLKDFKTTIGSLSTPIQHFFNYQYIKIDKELMKISKFEEDKDKGLWILHIEKRAAFETKHDSHSKGSELKGIVRAYNAVFLPDNNSPLFETITTNFAALLNDCKVSNALFDGAEIHAYDGGRAQGRWAFRKFAQQVYEKLDHPVVTRTSHGEEPKSGYIEYRLNMSKVLLQAPVGDHNHGRPSLRLEGKSHTHKSEIRPSSNLLAAHFMLSTQAAYDGRNFSILRPDPMFGIKLEALQAYGRTDELLGLLPKWKEASRRMTDAQRKTMLDTHTRYKHRLASEVGYELRENDKEFLIVPIQIMGQDENAIKDELKKDPPMQLFHMKQEDGMFVPVTRMKFGETKSLENKYALQSPQFIMRVMWSTPDNIVNPTIKLGKSTLTIKGTIRAIRKQSQYIEYRGGTTAKVYDKNWNLKQELEVKIKKNFEAQEGANEVSLKSKNKAKTEVELTLFTEGEPMRIPKNNKLFW